MDNTPVAPTAGVLTAYNISDYSESTAGTTQTFTIAGKSTGFVTFQALSTYPSTYGYVVVEYIQDGADDPVSLVGWSGTNRFAQTSTGEQRESQTSTAINNGMPF